MSIDCTRWAWTVPDLSPTAKLVLLHLADRANEHQNAWPTVKGISSDTGMSRAQVFRALATLRELGYVHPLGYGGKTGQAVVYKVCGRWNRTLKRWEKWGSQGETWSHSETPLGSHRDPGGLTVRPLPSQGETHNHQTTPSNQQQPAGAPTGERAGLGMQPADLLSDLKRSLSK